MAGTCVAGLGSPHDKPMTDLALSIGKHATEVDDYDGLPDGFPKQLSTEMAWCGTKLAKRPSYIYYLTDEDRLEIDLALASFYGQFYV